MVGNYKVESKDEIKWLGVMLDSRLNVKIRLREGVENVQRTGQNVGKHRVP